MLTPHPVYPGRILLARRGTLRGLGQDPGTIDPTTGFPIGTDSSGTLSPNCNPQTGQCAPTLPSTSTPSAQSGGAQTAGFNWGSLLGTAVTAAAKTAQQLTNPFAPSNLPAGTSYQMTPYGTTVMTAGSTPIGTSALFGTSALTGATLGNLLPILLVGGALVLFMSMGRR